eukprot:Sspe_Gene.35054::Locus_17005_Transcript_1_1_Confidence_1.000_Length_622::g.35054::m.35054
MQASASFAKLQRSLYTSLRRLGVDRSAIMKCHESSTPPEKMAVVGFEVIRRLSAAKASMVQYTPDMEYSSSITYLRFKQQVVSEALYKLSHEDEGVAVAGGHESGHVPDRTGPSGGTGQQGGIKVQL